MKYKEHVLNVILKTISSHKLISFGILITVFGAVLTALLPPLVLETIINRLTCGESIPFYLACFYFALTAFTKILESLRECLLTVFGQKITHSLRSEMCQKLSRLTADTFVKQEPGATAARFVGDVDTVENLFTSGIISMAADLCKIISIFIVIFTKNRGLALLLLLILPVLFAFTRMIQQKMLKSQLDNRIAVGKVTNHVPETVHCIRTIHTLGKEQYMREKYDKYIDESYKAIGKTNFYDSIYSPVVLILNALVIAAVFILSASGNNHIQEFFGMSVGTSVAIISYISQVFGPLENIGMEIQTIQSAIAGLHRIDEFLNQPERWKTDCSTHFKKDAPCIELKNVTFGYDENKEILHELSFTVKSGEQLTLSGRTGAGKSTIFKLLLGLYKPKSGRVMIHGQDAAMIPDCAKRRLFGYVEQAFRIVPGTVADQITLFDDSITAKQVEAAAKTVGLHETILRLENGYNTPCSPSLFSQGQWQLLSIARAIAAQPEILLLDEITANLDAATEQTVLHALRSASQNRTVLSISHRLYEQSGGRQINIDIWGRDRCEGTK